MACLENLQELKKFKEETFDLIKTLEARIYEYRIITEKTEDNQKDLKEHLKNWMAVFRP